MNDVLRITLYIICFLISAYGLSCVNFEKFIRRNKINESRVLYIVLSLALAYLMAQFMLGLSLNYYK